MTKIHPVAGYILIQPQKQESVTVSGIVLPNNDKEKPQQGKVLSVGGAIYRDGHEIVAPCQVNDIVIYKEWGVSEYKENDQKYLLAKFEDIIAIIK